MVYDSYEFGKYLMELRRKDNISMNVICDGICDVSAMSRIENGEKEVSKIVQDRLLGRLGVAPENFENMVFSDEYDKWELRQKIINYIQHEKIDEADELLEQMLRDYNIRERQKSIEDLDAVLELQFYLSMKAQIKFYRHADAGELRKLYADAVKQTVTGFSLKKSPREFLNGKRFSVEEINLLIEYGRYLPSAHGLGLIRGLVDYIAGEKLNELAKAKVYPKTVYYLYLLEKDSDSFNERKVKKLIDLCTQAIECLRDSLRTFYLCELLDMKMELIAKCSGVDTCLWNEMSEDISKDTLIDDNYEKMYGNTKEYSLKAQYIWCRHARSALRDIYRRCGVREDTFEYGYIYVDREVYCIEDVIRIRRSMLNMSMSKLSEGICSERTISRLEHKRTKPQCAIVHKLFKRLGLSGELVRTELISSNVEAQKMLENIRDGINYYKTGNEVETKIHEIEKIVSLDIPQNRQILERVMACSMRDRNLISDEEFVAMVKRAMEYTLPYDVAVSEGEKYMTIEELSCLHNIIVTKRLSSKEMNECYMAVLDMFEKREGEINNYLSMYEFMMRPIASYMGDKGMYDESDEKEYIILVNTMRNRRLTVMYSSMYGMLWNDRQRYKSNQAMCRHIAWKDEIKRCMVLSNLGKNIAKTHFFIKYL